MQIGILLLLLMVSCGRRVLPHPSTTQWPLARPLSHPGRAVELRVVVFIRPHLYHPITLTVPMLGHQKTPSLLLVLQRAQAERLCRPHFQPPMPRCAQRLQSRRPQSRLSTTPLLLTHLQLHRHPHCVLLPPLLRRPARDTQPRLWLRGLPRQLFGPRLLRGPRTHFHTVPQSQSLVLPLCPQCLLHLSLMLRLLVPPFLRHLPRKPSFRLTHHQRISILSNVPSPNPRPFVLHTGL